MAKTSSSIMYNLNAFITEKGRRYLFGKDSSNNSIRFTNGVDNFKVQQFSVYDSDVNYNSHNKLQSGEIPSISGTRNNPLKTSVNIKRDNAILYLGNNVPSVSFNTNQITLIQGQSTTFSIQLSHFPNQDLNRSVSINIIDEDTTLSNDAFSFSFNLPNQVTFNQSTGTEIEFNFDVLNSILLPVGESRRVVLELDNYINTTIGDYNKIEFIVTNPGQDDNFDDDQTSKFVSVLQYPDFENVNSDQVWNNIVPGDGCIRYWNINPIGSGSFGINGQQEPQDGINGQFIINEGQAGFLVDNYVTNTFDRKVTPILYQNFNIENGKWYYLNTSYGFERGRNFPQADFGNIIIEFVFFDTSTGINGDMLAEESNIKNLNRQTVLTHRLDYDNINEYNISNNNFELNIDSNNLIEKETSYIQAKNDYDAIGVYIKYNPTDLINRNERRKLMFASIINNIQLYERRII